MPHDPERLVPETDFPGLGPGYLNTASIGIPPAAAVHALSEEIERWAGGLARAPDYDAPVEAAREVFARLMGVPADDVAIGPQVSPFAAQALAALAPGAEVVAYRHDFTSLLFPLLVRADLRIDWVDHVTDLADAVGPSTALVAFSAVQSADGETADLDAIAAAAADHDALTLVDATQGCGWLPLEAGRFDFVVAAAYKWLLSPRGTAFMTIRRERLADLVPVAAGWYAGGANRWDAIYGPELRLSGDARRLDISPAWLSWIGTLAALEYLERTGIERIHDHDLALANRLREGLGMPPGTSAIVALDRPGAEEAARAHGLTAAVRAGRLRASFHLYNTEDDADLAIAAMSSGA